MLPGMSDATAPTSRTTTELPAGPDEAWEVLTSPDGVASWLGDDSRLSPVEGTDLDVADVETGVRRHGRVEVVEPGRRLGFVWWPAGSDPDEPGGPASRVAIQLVPHDGGTTLVVTESPVTPFGGTAPRASASVAGSTWRWRAAAVEVAIMSASLRATAAIR
jgi:uncharacterized protein YndB with AHSA1/START domain